LGNNQAHHSLFLAQKQQRNPINFQMANQNNSVPPPLPQDNAENVDWHTELADLCDVMVFFPNIQTLHHFIEFLKRKASNPSTSEQEKIKLIGNIEELERHERAGCLNVRLTRYE
jgi:hypothetical protein